MNFALHNSQICARHQTTGGFDKTVEALYFRKDRDGWNCLRAAIISFWFLREIKSF